MTCTCLSRDLFNYGCQCQANQQNTNPSIPAAKKYYDPTEGIETDPINITNKYRCSNGTVRRVTLQVITLHDIIFLKTGNYIVTCPRCFFVRKGSVYDFENYNNKPACECGQVALFWVDKQLS